MWGGAGESLRNRARSARPELQARCLRLPSVELPAGGGSRRVGASFSQARLNLLFQSVCLTSSARAWRSACRLRSFSTARAHAGAGAMLSDCADNVAVVASVE